MKLLSAKKIFAALTLLLVLLLAAAVLLWILLPKGGNPEIHFTARILSTENGLVTAQVLEQDKPLFTRKLPETFVFDPSATGEVPPQPGDTITGMTLPQHIHDDQVFLAYYDVSP